MYKLLFLQTLKLNFGSLCTGTYVYFYILFHIHYIFVSYFYYIMKKKMQLSGLYKLLHSIQNIYNMISCTTCVFLERKSIVFSSEFLIKDIIYD